MHEDGSTTSSPWSTVPLTALHAEIARRQSTGERPACGSSTSQRSYNEPLHVAALFLILLLSTLACSFPLIVRRFPRLPVPNYALFVSRHFGTGVLIATAFVHLLPTAYVNLTDPCLPPFWNETFPAMSGFVAMVSMFVVVAIEMFFATKGAGHSHGVDLEGLRVHSEFDGGRPGRSGSFTPLGPGQGQRQGDSGYNEGGEDGVPLQEQSSRYADDSPPGTFKNKPLPPEPPFEDDSDLDLDELDPQADSTGLLHGSAADKPDSPGTNGHLRPSDATYHISFRDEEPRNIRNASPAYAAERRVVLQCLLLEAGILFHSIFIGMALSVSTGSAFIVLLIAISFHQTFEGLALGSRIAAISSFSTSSPKPWLMSCLYGVTTPIGQAIGLAVHGMYDPESQFGLLTVGIVNAISSGLLLYAGLVQLLAEDFLSEKSYLELRGPRRLQACGAVMAGSMLMAFVGAFA